MKTGKIFAGLLCLTVLFLAGCQQENDLPEMLSYQNGAKLKRILQYLPTDNKDLLNIVAEYEYDNEGRISKVSSPMYQEGKMVGTIAYDVYEYGAQGHLAMIRNYNANLYSPTGFINLRNSVYTYSANGKIEKETIKFPQIGSFEYSLFKYDKDKLIRVEKYDKSDKLERSILNEYDKAGNITKETSFGNDNKPYSYTQHTYKNGLNVRSDVFGGKEMKEALRKIKRTYDKHGNLILLVSAELSLLSSAMSYVLKYEYFEN